MLTSTEQREYNRLYALIFPERIRQKKHKQYWRNPDKYRQRTREARRKNPEKIRASYRKWRLNHPYQAKLATQKWREKRKEHVRQTIKKWRKSHKKECLKHTKDWKYNNPEKVNACNALRRARKRHSIPPDVDLLAIKQIYVRAQWWRKRGFDVAVDHIFPLGFGWHEPDNLQIIYVSENHRKNCNPDYKPKIIFL
jgi:hypothetical protein